MADPLETVDAPTPDLASFATLTGQSLAAALASDQNLQVKLDATGKWLMKFIGAAVGAILDAVTWFVTQIQKLIETGNPGLGRLAATIIGTLFGHDVSGLIDTSGGAAGAGGESAATAGHAVLGAIFGEAIAGGGGSIEPGTDRAEAYLGTVAEMVLRGFFLNVITETVSLGQLKLVHELEEELVSGLGLGRIMRRVLAPFVTTLISDPAKWAINLAYRPKLLPPPIAVKQWLRGRLSDAQLDDELGRQGYSPDRIEALINDTAHFLSAEELQTLIDNDILDDATAADVLVQQGYEQQTAEWKFAALKFARGLALRRAAAQEWLQKYVDGLITEAVFVASIGTLGLPADELQLYTLIGGAHRETPRLQLSPSELKDAWNKSILTQAEVHDRMVQRGYSEDDATTWILLNLATVNGKDEAAQAKKTAEAARAAALAQKAADKSAAAAAAKQQAALDKAKKQADLQQQKAQAAAATEARKEFAATAAAQKKALVDTQQQTQLVDTDTAAAMKAKIDADTAALVAEIAGQSAQEQATFARQVLELRQADREATIAQQLDDIDLAATINQSERSAAVAARLATVDTDLAGKLANIETVFSARAQTIDDDKAAALDAARIAQLPTPGERQTAAAQATAALDAQLVARLGDLAVTTETAHAAIGTAIDNGDLAAAAADVSHGTVDVAAQYVRALAQQQHDVAVARLAAVAGAAKPVAPDAGAKEATTIQQTAEKALKSLAAAKLKATLDAQHAADAERTRLHVVAAQVGPISEAEVARRRLTVGAADASAKRAENLTATQIAKGEAAAQTAIQKAQATVGAAQQRLAAVEAANTAKEAAAAAAAAAQAALDAQLEQQRQALEAQLAAKAGLPTP